MPIILVSNFITAVPGGEKRVFSLMTTIISFLTAIITFFTTIHYFPLKITFNNISLIILFPNLILFIISIYILFKKKDVHFYPDKNQGPKYWENKKILKDIARKKLNLLVVGRTNITWLRNNVKMQKYYKKALINNCKIHFIIQHKNVENNNIDDVTRNEIINDHPEAIKYYKELYEYLGKEGLNAKENFKLFLTNTQINNSMVAQYKTEDYYTYFSYDIDKNIKKSKNPYLVFRNTEIIDGIKYELDSIKKNSTDIFDYDIKKSEIEKNIDKLLIDFSLSSVQRLNKNKKMLNHYFERKNCIENKVFYPPFSIQLMITNKCTANCVMCDHHLINSKSELSKIDTLNIIDYIYDIGTKNIIISGGEPFARCDCINIMEYAKKKELNIGIITNGVMKNGVSITLSEAARIKKYCDWVQLSIDSFNENTYKQIRNIDLNIVKESLENLEAVGVNLELVFTIQKLNINETIDMVTTGKAAFGFKSKVRFKFAHGPDNNNNFLLTNETDKLEIFLKNSANEVNFYSRYFNEMIAKNYFTKEDILKGEPLYSINRTFNDKKYKCHAINYSCVIDAEGNLYPCCFLYDDNAGNDSTIRNKYNSGSLRTNGVIAPLTTNENRLKLLLTENYNRYLNNKIPVDEKACNYCTRHFYQNAFLNELDKIVNENIDFNFNEFYSYEEDDKIWF
jgi:MoaA/NifB/PqqE/SkfB family radical SAM enzyme